MITIILYIAVGLFLLGGLYVRWWYLTDFRRKIGNAKFGISTLIDFVAFTFIIYLIGLDLTWALKFIVIGLWIVTTLLVSIYLYRKESRLNKPIEPDRE